MRKVCNQERIETICVGIREGVSMPGCAKAAGISESTLMNWLKRGRIQYEAIEDGTIEAPIFGEDPFHALYEAALLAEGSLEKTLVRAWMNEAQLNWQAAEKLLAKRFPKEWGAVRGDRDQGDDTDAESIKVEIYIPSNGRD